MMSTQTKFAVNEELQKFLARIKGCPKCDEAPKVEIQFTTGVGKDGKPTVEKANICDPHWNTLASSDIEWRSSP